MAGVPNSTNSPMAEYLLKLQLIVSNTEFKDKSEAKKYETPETKSKGTQYVNAILHKDAFTSYTYTAQHVYTVLTSMGIDDQKAMFYIDNPEIMPIKCQNVLMEEARQNCIATYKEQNKYYLMLTGQPFPGNDTIPADPILTIPDGFYEIYKSDQSISRDEPIHELPKRYQELFINSPYYSEMIRQYPDVRYIRYIGSNSIPIEVSRYADDGDILKINTSKLSTYHEIFGNVVVTPDIVHKFVNVYRETRDYVYYTLRGDFSEIYANYDSFIRFLTIYLAIGNTMTEFQRSSSGYIHMNNITANNLFMLYGLPSVIMQGSSMISFLKKFRTILVDKGTNIVYRVKDLIGYKYTDIYTLVMVKQQKFENGLPVYTYNDDGTKTPVQEIVFRRLGTTEDNTSYFKYRDSKTTYTVEEITSGDPRWWNTPEVESMIQDMNYTLSNSKYIQLSTHLSMSDIWWQCVILLRGILDNNSETKYTKINVNYNINGSSEMTVFDAVLTLIILMNNQLKDFRGNTADGNLYIPNGIYDGKAACIDMLFNGLHMAKVYQQLTFYSKGDVIGESLDELYVVVDDYMSSDQGISYDVEHGDLIPYSEVYDKPWDEGSPKELIPGSPFKIASFNFDIRNESPTYYNSLRYQEYLEPDIFIQMLESVLDRQDNNIGMSLMTEVKSIYKYLETKLVEAKTIQQFRVVTDAYNHLFLVDPLRRWDQGTSDNTDDLIIDEYGLSENEWASLKSFFTTDPDNPDLVVDGYPIYLTDVLNLPVYVIRINGEYPFRDNETFVQHFESAILEFHSDKLESSGISRVIKNNYQSIIHDKVYYDSTNTEYGPKTFDALLRVTNVDLYKYIRDAIRTGKNDVLINIIRSIVNALEDYTNSSLVGLNYAALGVDNYIDILKQVITYFKSYMVEFTKEEFTYIFDGLFDNGGNSNMLKLYDELTAGEVTIVPHDSTAIFDASTATINVPMMEYRSDGIIRDEVLFRVESTYGDLVNSGYEIIYDTNEYASTTPFPGLDSSTRCIADIAKRDSAYKIILNIKNTNLAN
jgi:hypothetical protein